jgi:hypothetical protein
VVGIQTSSDTDRCKILLPLHSNITPLRISEKPRISNHPHRAYSSVLGRQLATDCLAEDDSGRGNTLVRTGLTGCPVEYTATRFHRSACESPHSIPYLSLSKDFGAFDMDISTSIPCGWTLSVSACQPKGLEHSGRSIIHSVC